MGVVYKGFDNAIQRSVAIKVLHTYHQQGAESESLIARFRQEAQAAARCHHQNIVAIFEYGTTQLNEPYIVMEYVEGIELKRILVGKTINLTLKQAISISLQILTALNYAHQHQVVHRDIKPSNIIITREKQVKIMDFGVAHLDMSDLTIAGYIVGTPSYMSPEALRAENVDHRSDIYAVGQVLLEMLSAGEKLRGDDNITHQITEQLNKNLSTYPLKDTLASIIEKALAFSPQQRYQTAGEFLIDLKQALKELRKSSYNTEHYLNTLVIERKDDEPAEDITEYHEKHRTDTPANNMGYAKALTAFLSAKDIALIEESLAIYIGPLSKVLVRKEIGKQDSLQHYIKTLASFIPTDSERQAFIRTIKASGIHKIPSAVVTDPIISQQRYDLAFLGEELESLEKALTNYMGPIAYHLIQPLANKQLSYRDLAISLAKKIDNPKEREAFLQEVDLG